MKAFVRTRIMTYLTCLLVVAVVLAGLTSCAEGMIGITSGEESTSGTPTVTTPAETTPAPTPAETTTKTPETTEAEPDGTVEATNPDGTAEATDPDGTAEATNPDGTAEATDPDATTEVPTPDATTEVPTPEATTEVPTPEATTEVPTPEATTEVPTPEATTEVPTPEATTELPTPEATTEVPTPEATTAVPTPEETTHEIPIVTLPIDTFEPESSPSIPGESESEIPPATDEPESPVEPDTPETPPTPSEPEDTAVETEPVDTREPDETAIESEPVETREPETIVPPETAVPPETEVPDDPDDPDDPSIPGDCDHSNAVRKFYEYPGSHICGTVLPYFTCDCTEVLYLDAENTVDNCNWRLVERITDEEGNTIGMDQECIDCGLRLLNMMEYVSDGCTQGRIMHYIFSYGEDGEKTDLVFESLWTNHNIEYYTIDLGEYGCCGGWLYVAKCADCGFVESAYSDGRPEDCAHEYTEYSEETDENGTITYHVVKKCDKCSFGLVADAVDKQTDTCERKLTVELTYFVGDEILCEYVGSNYTYNHSYGEPEIELDGETCDSGVILHYTCSVCGDEYHDRTYEHDTVLREFDMAEFGCCEGHLSYYQCVVCNEIVNIVENSISCNFSVHDKGPIYDDEGNAIGDFDSVSCPECGLTQYREYKRYTVDCTQYEVDFEALKMGDEVLLVYRNRISENDVHAYIKEFELYGESCEDGIMVVTRCENCDYYDEDIKYYHMTSSSELVELSACGSYVYAYVCDYCGHIDHIRSVHLDGCDLSVTEEDILNEEGIKIGTKTTSECSSCGIVLIQTRVITYSEGCYENGETTLLLLINGEEFYYEEGGFSSEGHDYKEEYIKHGDSCDDGYEIIKTCTKCGDREKG